MTTLVVGASGATGKLLVEQLLQAGLNVKVVVRPSAKIPATWQQNGKVTLIKANISEIRVDEMAGYVRDCHAVLCCLGHTLSWKGIYGKPRKLVTDSVGLICNAIERNSPGKPVKFILMNTAGNRNRDLQEPISTGERLVTGLLRMLLPPHPDNEKAADYLRANIGQDNRCIQWVAVRPDTLIDQDHVTAYELHASPTRSALFNAGKTSRINVANLMARLTAEENVWSAWKGQMPVIYNSVSASL